MPAEPLSRVTVVRDPHDTPDTRAVLTRIDNLDRGVIVVRPVPGTTSPAVLALAVLAALGKRVDTRPRGPQNQWWSLARAWAVGHQVDYLVVDRAHTLPATLIHDLIDLAAAAGVAGVWFVDASPRRIAPALADIPLDMVTERPRQLLNLSIVERDRPHDAHRGLHIGTDALPHAGFLTFRYACQRQLTGADAAVVDGLWQQTYRALDRWLHDRQLFVHGRPDDQRLITELPRLAPMISAKLAATFYTSTNPAHALVQLRAAQAVLFCGGLLLHHEPRQAVLPDRTLGCPLTSDIAATINRATSTAAAAAAVLHLIHTPGVRYPITNMPPWKLAHIADDGSRLHTEHDAIPVPACGRAMLRAHLHWRQLAGATDPTAALFDDRRHTFPELAQQALHPLNLAGPANVGYRRHRAYLRGHATPWMQQRGLELSALADLAPRPGTT
jgi:hypothetical protein